MKRIDGARRERLFAWALLALAVLAFFSLNLLTRVMRDDYSYSFNFATKERVASFGDIFQSLAVHYRKVNGRLVVHFFAHLFLWLGKGAFAVLNTLGFSVLTVLICCHARGTFRPFDPYAALAAFLGLWVLTPAFGESFLWVTGAANYLYGMLLILLFLLPFRRLWDADSEEKHPIPAAQAAFCGGVLAGWTNENTAGALLVLLLCELAGLLARKRRVPLWFWAGLLGCAAGLALLVLAPGELSRLDGAGGMGGLRAILRRALKITYQLVKYLWPGILAWAALLYRLLRRGGGGRDLALPLGFLLAGLAAAYSMALSPVMPARVWSGPIVYFLISLLALRRAAGEPCFAGARTRLAAVTLCAALALAIYACSAPRVAKTAAAFDAREAEAAAQLRGGARTLTLPPVYGSGDRFDAAEVPRDIGPDAEHWLNQALARYLGADAVTGAP